MTYQPKKRQRSKEHGFRKEWKLNQEEMFLKQEDKKVEKD